MEIIIAVIALGIIAWVGYTYVLDKERVDGSHPLDSVKGNSELPTIPVVTRTGDIVESTGETSTATAVENQITDSVTQANVETKKEKKMATKKPAKPAPAKEPKKPAPAKKPKK